MTIPCDQFIGSGVADCFRERCGMPKHDHDLAAAIRAEQAEALAAKDREIADAMAVLKPNMPQSGLVDACRQVKQAAISAADNCEKAEAQVATLTARVQALALKLELESADLKRAAETSLQTEASPRHGTQQHAYAVQALRDASRVRALLTQEPPNGLV